ncbi:MAG: O-antigen ligase family protein [Candidatus Eisenbacteria bacterium]|nr:O-antigen ligase family protein [Candidatus Eisenbacteria bacterium]
MIERGVARRALGCPWAVFAVAIAAIALGVAFAPFAVSLVVGGAAVAGFLVWRFGAIRGMWYLVLLTLPLKEPLSFSIAGTVSAYPIDFLAIILLAAVIRRDGIARPLRESASLRVIGAIMLLSLVGLYTASNVFWGVASVYRIVMQLVVFALAASIIRTPEDALRALAAVAASLVVPALYGFYQASLPYGAPVPAWGYRATAYDLRGTPFLRVFSTMDHPLHFSHYMSIALGLSLGLAAGARSAARRGVLLALAGLAVAANLLTYSASGVVGVLASFVAAVLALRSRRLVAALVAAVIALAVLAPPPLVAKLERMLKGDAATTAARLVTYEQSFMIIRDHPLLGVGWGGIRSAMQGEYRITRADPVAYTAENYFLQRAVALGLVGLSLYVALLVRFIRNVHALRNDRSRSPDRARVGTALLIGAVVFFAQAQLIPAANVSTNSVLWLFYAAAEALRLAPGGPGAVEASTATAAGGGEAA